MALPDADDRQPCQNIGTRFSPELSHFTLPLALVKGFRFFCFNVKGLPPTKFVPGKFGGDEGFTKP
jgi:hypothetical protein